MLTALENLAGREDTPQATRDLMAGWGNAEIPPFYAAINRGETSRRVMLDVMRMPALGCVPCAVQS